MAKRLYHSPKSPGPTILTSRRYDLVWYVALLLLVFLLGCFQLNCVDIWWHLRTGQLIWERWEVPRTDWFTFTNPEATWIDLHWGFQLLAAGLWEVGKAPLLILANCLLGTATVAVCLSIGESRWPMWQTVACWLVPVLVFAVRYYPRPEMLTALLLVCTLAVLYHARSRPWLVWLLPLIQLVWVNVHGLFVLQLVVLGCYLADVLVRQGLAMQVRRRCSERGPNLRTLLAALGATAVAALANPYGIAGALFPVTLFARVRGPERAFYHKFSAELKGLDTLIVESNGFALISPTIFVPIVLFLVGLGTFGLLAARQHYNLFRLLIFAAFAYLTWQMFRNVALFALVAGVVLRLNVGDLVEAAQNEVDEPRTKGQPRRGTIASTNRRFGPGLVAICLGMLIVSVPSGIYFDAVYNRPDQPKRLFGLGEMPTYCHAVARLLAAPGMPQNIYAADTGPAAVCIYHLGPEKRVFADPRLETNTRETLYRYYEVGYQLAAGDLRAEENLKRYIQPDENGHRELPALLFDNRTLYLNSLQPPRQLLFQRLMNSNRWRCVHFDAKPPADWSDVTSIFEGTTLFLETERAEKLNLPRVDAPLLERLIQETLETRIIR